MYYGIKGKLYSIDPSVAIVDVNGILYEININIRVYEKYKEFLKKEVFFYTYLYIKDDIMRLYGFSSIEEKEFFIKLLSVSGIGPNKAMAILSFEDYEILKQAVLKGDPSPFKRVKGIGTKQAQKLIIELSGKISVENEIIDNTDKMIYDGLKSLGFKDEEIKNAFKKFAAKYKNTNLDFEEKFKKILSFCSKV